MAWWPSGRAHSPGSFVLSGPFTITWGRWNRQSWLLLPPSGPGTQLLIRPKSTSSALSVTDGLRRKAASSSGIESAAKETKSSVKSYLNSTVSSAPGACSRLCHKRCVANSLVFLYSICKLYLTLFFFFPFQSEFIAPLWYPKEIENAIRSLSVAVINSYYGGCSPVNRKPIKRIRVDKSHRPSLAQYHDSTRCQACHDGLCVASGFFV